MTDQPAPIAATPSLGAAKIVKLGPETLLVVEISNGGSVPEGDVNVSQIKAIPAESDIGGAGICEARVSCSGNCVVRWGPSLAEEAEA